MDKSSLEKLLRITTMKKKRVKQQRQSPSYDTLLLLLKFRRSRSQGSNLSMPEFFQAFFSQLHKLRAFLTLMTFSVFISA